MKEDSQLVLLEEPTPGVCLLRLNRPESRNALSVSLMKVLHARLDELRVNRDCRVVILTGSGASFCAGADLKERGVSAPAAEGMTTLGIVYKTQEYLVELMLKLRELPQPVISVVRGAAVGGGLALALVSDICIAEEDARFGAVFIKAGLSSCDVGVSYMLPRVVGPQRAAEIMLTGRLVESDEAERIGLVYAVVPGSEGERAALAKAAMIVENNEYGVWMTKKGMWAGLDAPSLRHAMEMENRTQALGYFTGNMEEAMSAFVEKRPPKWKRL